MEYGRAERDIGWGRLTSNTPYQLFPLFHSPDREGLRYQSHQFSFQKIYEYLYNGSPSSLLRILARPSVYWPVNMIRNKCLYACHTVSAVSCLGEKTFLLTPITYILWKQVQGAWKCNSPTLKEKSKTENNCVVIPFIRPEGQFKL